MSHSSISCFSGTLPTHLIWLILKKERPEIKSVLMSGYTDNIVARQGVLKPGIIFINKPLRPISLATKIRSVMDNKGKEKK